MKKITFYLLFLVACTETPDPEPVKPVWYSFNVKAPDGGKFKAEISWSIYKHVYKTSVDAVLYFSGFDAVPGRVFTITAEGAEDLDLIILFYDENTRLVKTVPLQPNVTYKFDHNLNY
jgi:hypothetical protein